MPFEDRMAEGATGAKREGQEQRDVHAEAHGGLHCRDGHLLEEQERRRGVRWFSAACRLTTSNSIDANCTVQKLQILILSTKKRVKRNLFNII